LFIKLILIINLTEIDKYDIIYIIMSVKGVFE